MNRDGFASVKAAVSRYKNVLVSEPLEYDDVRYFSIYEDPTWKTVEPSRILRALDKEGLMLHSEKAFDPANEAPQLRYLGAVGLTLTFEDLSAK